VVADPTMRPARSFLFVPGHDEHKLERALASDADCVIVDLEDSVPRELKRSAREACAAFLSAHTSRPLLALRVNAADTGEFEDDLAAAAAGPFELVWIPKAQRPADVVRAERLLGGRSTFLAASLETARGVFAAHAIVSARARIAAVSVGTAVGGDLEADLGARWSADGGELHYLRSHVLIAARAADIGEIVDGAYTDFRDGEGLRASAIAARCLGYTGKMVIHPAQIPTVNEVFTPTMSEVDYATRVLETFDGALAKGGAAASLDGKMIDYATAGQARRLLDRAASLQRAER